MLGALLYIFRKAMEFPRRMRRTSASTSTLFIISILILATLTYTTNALDHQLQLPPNQQQQQLKQKPPKEPQTILIEEIDKYDDKVIQQYIDRLEPSLEKLSLEVEQIKDKEFELRAEKNQLEDEVHKLKGAKAWESDEKKLRLEELDKFERDLLRKQMNASEIAEKVSALRAEIKLLRKKKAELETNTAASERQLQAPRLIDALEESSGDLGHIGQQLLNRTVNEIIPEVEELSNTMFRMKSQLNPVAIAISAIFLYVCAVVSVVFMGGMYQHIRGFISIHRILFSGDVFFTLVWFVCFVLSVLIKTDPMYIIYMHSKTMFVLGLVSSLIAYVSLVLLRVSLLTTEASLTNLLEVLVSIAIGHHYFVSVWEPALLDSFARRTYTYYLLYSMLCLILACRRPQTVAGAWRNLYQTIRISLLPLRSKTVS